MSNSDTLRAARQSLQSFDDFQVKETDKKDLTKVKSLTEACALYGIKKSDLITRRELISVYKKLRDVKEREYHHLVDQSQYKKAKVVSQQLKKINEECDEWLVLALDRKHLEQQKLMEKARKIRFAQAESKDMDERMVTQKMLKSQNDEKDAALLARKEELEAHIKQMPKPRMRFSKYYVDLLNSEKHLARLERFDEAADMAKKRHLLYPSEVENFEASFQHKKEALRKKLAAKEEFEKVRRYEYNRNVNHLLKVRQQGRSKVLVQNQKNLETDLKHSQFLESQEKPERVFHPSVTRREHYRETAGVFRGEQLLQSLGGKEHKSNVPALCEIHDFEQELDGTIRLTE